MIKRQFYSIEHRSRDDASSSSSSSSSSSDSESEVESDVDSENNVACSSPVRPSPGNEDDEDDEVEDENEDADEDEDGDEDEDEDEDGGAGKPYGLTYSTRDDALEQPHEGKHAKSKAGVSNQWADLVEETLAEKDEGIDDECVIRCKNVLKCRWCPKTICLSNESMQSHLMSKKHARSLKLMKDGKLKVMLNSDGEEEEQGETHAERHARTIASIERVKAEGDLKRKKESGRQRQRKRAKRKASVVGMENKGQLPTIGHGSRHTVNKRSGKVEVAMKTFKKKKLKSTGS